MRIKILTADATAQLQFLTKSGEVYQALYMPLTDLQALQQEINRALSPETRANAFVDFGDIMVDGKFNHDGFTYVKTSNCTAQRYEMGVLQPTQYNFWQPHATVEQL